jgi:predicted RNA methylase
MIFQHLQTGQPLSDAEFDTIYPSEVSSLSGRHWTKIAVAKKAAAFLVSGPATKVLDVGAGAGKFCFIGAATTPGHFFGIEQRAALVALTQGIIAQHQLQRVHMRHANVVDIDFREYDAFYLFNPFYENIRQARSIDKSLPLSRPLYNYYKKYVYDQLSGMPTGTRVATYAVNKSQIPPTYRLTGKDLAGQLKFYEKQ